MDTTKLNAEQREAVTHVGGPLMVVAGAGTGKTTVITKRVQFLIEEGHAKPSEILALTFTDKAAQEMQDRIDEALPLGYSQLNISTFHAFCDKLLRRYGHEVGIDTDYTLLTQAESIDFLRRNIFELKLSYFRPLGNPTKFVAGLLTHFSRLQDETITPEKYLKWAETLPDKDEIEKLDKVKWVELANSFEAYEKLKEKYSVFDFGDLIARVIRMFDARPNILAQVTKNYPFVLVDEYQDTNFAQSILTRYLGGKNGNITVVLDDDQSIYRFRGAAISNALQFRSHFPSTKIVTLTKNYRSFQKILDTAYSAIQFNNPDRLEVKEGILKKLTSMREGVGEVTFLPFETGSNESEGVVQKIAELHGDSYKYGDVAILVRANSHADPFIRELEAQGISYQMMGQGKLFFQDEILDLVSYIRFIGNVSDSQSLYRVLTSPVVKIPAHDVAKLLARAHTNTSTLFEVCEGDLSEEAPDSKVKIEEFMDLVRMHLSMKAKKGLLAVIYDYLVKTGYLSEILASEDPESLLKGENIAAFLNRIKQYEERDAKKTFDEVSSWLELNMSLGDSPNAVTGDFDEDSVKILTVHASKGLEFPVVFLVNLVSQRFPSMDRQDQIPIPEELISEIQPSEDPHLQEERRLFYVGATRARDKLFLTGARFYGDAKREKKFSPFIFEALPSALNTEKAVPSGNTLSVKEDVSFVKETTRKDLKVSYISYSQIETFKMCPLHYKLSYVLKLPKPSSSAQSFGNTIHNVLRAFYEEVESGATPDQSLLTDLLSKKWIPYGYHNKSHMEEARSRAVHFLKYFLEKSYRKDQHDVHVETPFSFKISDLKVGGIIDRIEKDNDTLHIIDYKTGSNVLTQKEADKNLQLSIYALAATKISEPPFGYEPSKVKLSLVYFETEEIVTTARTKEDLKAAEEEILLWREKLENSDFHCSGHPFCRECEYASFCQADSLSQSDA